MTEHAISRRNFLAGAGVAAATLGAFGLAGCSSPKKQSEKASSSATASTSAGSGMGDDGSGANPWLGEKPQIADSDVTQTIDADVVVVGLGAAGCPAARAAAEAGAKVVALEASSKINSVATDMAIIGGKTMATWGRGDGFMDKKTVVNMHMEEGSHHSSQEIISRWFDESGAALDWFIEADPSLYVAKETFEDIPEANRANFLFPYMYPLPAHYDYTKEDLPCYPTSVGFSDLAGMMQKNLQVAIDKGADIHYDTKGVALIQNDAGEVTGVYAQEVGSSSYIKINAKSVVITTGDYLENDDMMAFFQPECDENGIQRLSLDMDKNGAYTNVGDGHKMLAWAGAEIEQWHAPMIHHMGGGAGSDGRGVIGNNGFLWLNKNGKRFMNEDVPGQQLENQVERQPDHFAWQFFDGAWPQELEYFPANHGCACFYREDGAVPDWYSNGQKINIRTPSDIQAAVDDGRCIKADTLDELLSKLDIDAAEAKKSIERYNELAKAGEDTDFFKSSQRLFALQTPPFYAAKCGVALTLGNEGGAISDGDCHVYAEDGTLIKGVYVAGAPQGGRFNVQYPISMKGLSLSMCMTFGKIAGTNAATQA